MSGLRDECVTAYWDGRLEDAVRLADECVAQYDGRNAETVELISEVLHIKAAALASASLEDQLAPLELIVDRCRGSEEDAVRVIAAEALAEQIRRILAVRPRAEAITLSRELTCTFTEISGPSERLAMLADSILRIALNIEKQGERRQDAAQGAGRGLPAGTVQALVMVSAVVEKFGPLEDVAARQLVAKAEDVRGAILARAGRLRGAVQAITRSYDAGARYWPWTRKTDDF